MQKGVVLEVCLVWPINKPRQNFLASNRNVSLVLRLILILFVYSFIDLILEFVCYSKFNSYGMLTCQILCLSGDSVEGKKHTIPTHLIIYGFVVNE